MGPDLSGQRVVVFGATGNVGHGAAAAFLAAGATVLAPTRDAGSASTLAQRFGDGLVPVVGDISDPVDAPRLAAALRDEGPLDHVFASLGPWWQGGALAGQPTAEWARVRRMLLDGHVHAASQLIPALRDQASSYTVVTGMGAHQVIPGTSLLFVAVNGVTALSKVLRSEHGAGPRVNELLIHARIEKTARPGVVPSEAFGRAAVALAASSVRSRVVDFHSPDRFTLP